MNEKQMVLGCDFENQNLSGWFGSEKLDGCRGYWDGAQFWTRGGNVINAPARIAAQMPADVEVDGEFFGGRAGFQLARVAVQHGKFSDAVRFVAFDFPDEPGNYLERLEAGARFNLETVTPFAIRDNEHAFSVAREIVASNGEGIVARHPSVGYERARNTNFLKIKPTN
jgi:DNA ligase-1